MLAQILDGKAAAKEKLALLKQTISQHTSNGSNQPCLAVILVGDDPASHLYVERKRQACVEVGIRTQDYSLPTTSSQAKLLNLIKKLNQDIQVNGILIQLPLPHHIDTRLVIEAIDPAKDVDGFHPYNLGRLAQQRPTLRPCTPYGIRLLLEHYQLNISGLDAAVIGASNIVGRPMALELLMAGCTVTVCHSLTQDLAKHVAQADLLISAIGKTGIIQSEWIKPGAIVVDVGINRHKDGHLQGDIDFTTAQSKASWITPVPGGVGPMTVATLLENTWRAARNN